MALPAALTKKVAGLPVGAWLIIIGGGIAIGLYLRKRNQDAMDGEGEIPSDQGGDTVPFSSLASEQPYDGFPLTGGGPPIVGGSALRIEGPSDPIRIIIRGPRPPRPGTRRCRRGFHWNAARKRCVRNRAPQPVGSGPRPRQRFAGRY